ncbi:M23 family metallopeptidase [Rhizobium leguminosarum]|uniref:M23 family metallopeptidase n=1 Tax=Rhizobium leguminosarum TaxID=384 RepID=UPI00293DAA86|nr:M23 family metallopeptidase [Rhizobium leguminosarum]MDV4164388.1 M23 family metallopeptidase [Rhizobium leguminosarum]MDV4174674.1 M23 family metallopeptidase [Rhizobium leguminosarum]
MAELVSENPCDNPPNWPAAPTPASNPLAVMELATGKKKDRFGCTRDGGKKFHAGIDIKAATGTECFAVSDAKVEEVGFGKDVGKYVSISFKDGSQVVGVAYCHLSETLVKKGAHVKAGEAVGKTGTTWNADTSEPHLHIEYQTQVWVAYANPADRSKVAVDPNALVSDAFIGV